MSFLLERMHPRYRVFLQPPTEPGRAEDENGEETRRLEDSAETPSTNADAETTPADAGADTTSESPTGETETPSSDQQDETSEDSVEATDTITAGEETESDEEEESTEFFDDSGLTDNEIAATVTDDGMEASVNVKVNGAVSRSAIVDALQRAGVIAGYDNDAIDTLMDEDGPRGFPVVVARGKPPGEGISAKLELYFERNPQPQVTYDEQGHANYKEVGVIQQVKAGDLLAVKSPAERGDPGYTVRDKQLAGVIGRDIPLAAGPGTKFEDKDGFRLVAISSGAVSMLDDNRISVSEQFIVEGDVDFSTGNIRFDGAVHVRGNVIAGFAIYASGDIEINGVVEDAYIHCGGNLQVRGGFLGKGNGIARVCGETHIRFLENQKVIGNGDVHIAEEIIYANVITLGQVVVRYGKGAIIGGTVAATKGINAKIAGNLHNQRTNLIVGVNQLLSERMNKATDALAHKTDMKEVLQQALDKLMKQKYEGKKPLSPEQSEAIDLLYEHMGGIDRWTQEIETLRDQWFEQINLLEKEARITVDNEVHSGVKITIGSRAKLIDEDFGRSEFHLEDDMVVGNTAKKGKSR
ncbi:DUF342 domain-containing protein [bacterium]|nr:DUF342 domain-containing protein [bacterium]